MWAKLDKDIVWEFNDVRLFWIAIDKYAKKPYKYVSNICSEANRNTALKVSVFGFIPHSDWIRENTNQNNSEYGHFSRDEN